MRGRSRLVGDHPLILAAMAVRVMLMVVNGFDTDVTKHDHALSLAGRAVAIDPDCVDALLVIGGVNKVLGNLEVERPGASASTRHRAESSGSARLAHLALAEAGQSDETRTLTHRLALRWDLSNRSDALPREWPRSSRAALRTP